MIQEYTVVGQRLPRSDAAEKVTGAARFIGDIKLPHMLIGKVLRSPHAHARVIAVDASKVEQCAGVEAVLTPRDIPNKPFSNDVFDMAMPEGVPPEMSGMYQDQFVLNERVRFVGDAVAAVAAVNEHVAEEALKLFNVEYELLPPACSLEQAAQPEALRIHDRAVGNICHRMPFPFSAGDVEKAFAEAACVVEGTFSTTRQKHAQMELDACIASFSPGGMLTVWSPHQLMYLARRSMAHLFGIPVGKIRWLTPPTGGGFGGRLVLNAEPICIALAMKAGRPVKLEYTREEDFIVHDSRTPHKVTIKMGLNKEGVITAVQCNLLSDAGAYVGQSVMTTVACMVGGLGHYLCPNLAGGLEIVYSNTPITGGMRGYGNPEAMWALEQLVDEAAHKLRLDPLEIRLKNCKKPGDLTFFGVPIQSVATDECIREGARRIGWAERGKRAGNGSKKRGIGMATMEHASGAAPLMLEHSNAYIKFNEDGSAVLTVSPCEMGQGILGVLAQIAAEELGLKAEDIQVVSGDTNVTRFDIGSHASRSTYVIGNAVLNAAREAKGQIIERAASLLGVSSDALEVKNNRIFSKEDPAKGLLISDVVKDALYNFKQQCLQITGRSTYEATTVSQPGQACFAEVEVDTETGEVKVLKLVIAHDIGKAINPMNVEGQLEGGSVQGLGFCLTEDFAFRTDNGVTITDNFNTYKLPSALEVPEIEVALVEKADPVGPYGAKGVGETGMVIIAPAIANAVYDAVGIRIKDLPITPEKVRKALEENK